VIDGDPADGHLSMILVFLILLAAVGGVYLHMRWQSRSASRQEHTMEVLQQSHDFSVRLVKHFMPSFKVQKYQFRGMTAMSGTLNIAFADLSFTVGSGKRVLEGVTGEIPSSGSICAIMGPSGAGKTTFLNVLCGKATYGKVGGTIRINGAAADFRAAKGMSGFVPQDDIVHEDLTVREQINFSARLRNKAGTTGETIEAITEDVLNVLQLDHIQHSIVGGVDNRRISGGQRKCVNIGLELAAEPTVLFLDEPTTGLDSTSALATMFSLSRCQTLRSRTSRSGCFLRIGSTTKARPRGTASICMHSAAARWSTAMTTQSLRTSLTRSGTRSTRTATTQWGRTSSPICSSAAPESRPAVKSSAT